MLFAWLLSFVLATLEGAFSLAKNAQDLTVFTRSVSGLADYLQALAIKKRNPA